MDIRHPEFVRTELARAGVPLDRPWSGLEDAQRAAVARVATEYLGPPPDDSGLGEVSAGEFFNRVRDRRGPPSCRTHEDRR